MLGQPWLFFFSLSSPLLIFHYRHIRARFATQGKSSFLQNMSYIFYTHGPIEYEKFSKFYLAYIWGIDRCFHSGQCGPGNNGNERLFTVSWSLYCHAPKTPFYLLIFCWGFYSSAVILHSSKIKHRLKCYERKKRSVVLLT